MASGKASHHASCSGASRDSSPVDAGALYLVWSRCRNLRKPLQCLHGPWGTSGVSQVSQSSSLVDACTCNFLQSCSISVTLPFAWIQESVAFRGGFLTRLCHEAFPRRLPQKRKASELLRLLKNLPFNSILCFLSHFAFSPPCLVMCQHVVRFSFN